MSQRRPEIALVFGKLRERRAIAPAIVDALELFLRRASDADLFHINPFAVAETARFEPEDRVRALLAAESVGLVERWFNTLCVFCGAIERRFEAIEDAPNEHFRCTQCAADIDVREGARIEVSFRLHRALGSVTFDPFASVRDYRRSFVSANVRPAAAFASYLSRVLLAHGLLREGERRSFAIEVRDARRLRVVSFDRHISVTIPIAEAAPSSVDVVIGLDEADAGAVSPQRTTVVLHNAGPGPVGVFILDGDTDAWHREVASAPPEVRPFLSARELRAIEGR
ncbi:MAG: hypothetical protein JNK05_31165 [Myxococcales bacterium]|nr:hypothetical protein [Myxococcales bacterium]